MSPINSINRMPITISALWLSSLPRTRTKGSSQWREIRFPNHRILSSCRLMFERSSGKGKPQIGMAKFQAPRGFGEISTPAGGVVFRRKNFANPILLPLTWPQERTNGDRKTQKKTVDSRKRIWFIRNFTSQLLDPHKK